MYNPPLIYSLHSKNDDISPTVKPHLHIGKKPVSAQTSIENWVQFIPVSTPETHTMRKRKRQDTNQYFELTDLDEFCREKRGPPYDYSN